MASSSMTTLADNFKEVFSDRSIEDMSLADKPLYGMMPKGSNFYGSKFSAYIRYGKPVGGASKTFSYAQADVTSSSGQKFEVTRVPDYGIVHIDRESLEASEEDIGAFFAIKAEEEKLSLEYLAEKIWTGLYGDAYAYLGVVGSESTTALTLATVSDICKFEVGQTLKFYDSSHNARTGTAVITAINRNTGVLTSGSNWTSQITSLAATDYATIYGDKGKGISGLNDWCPASDPGATEFFGVNRALDVVRLGGIRLNYSTLLINEALNKALYIAKQHRAKGLSHCFLHPTQFAALTAELGAKKDLCSDTAKGEGGKEIAHIGFDGIMLHTPFGNVKCFADEMCQPTVAWIVAMKDLEFKSLKGAPRMLNLDGMRERESYDEYELRNGWNGNMICYAPGHIVRVTLGEAA